MGNGDGTVPITSENIGNLNISNMHKYYVNSDHSSYNNSDAVKLLDNIIELDIGSNVGSIHSVPENVKN